MFRAAANPFDDLVAKATDEGATDINWGLNLELCDKVSDSPTPGARNATLSLQKRLLIKNPNVQLYSLELANTLAENCGPVIRAEISSKSFTDTLQGLVNDRMTNEKVKEKVLELVKKWAAQFGGDSDYGILADVYDKLKRNGMYSTSGQSRTHHNEDEARARERAREAAEEDEFQKAIELSKREASKPAPSSTNTIITSTDTTNSNTYSNEPAAAPLPPTIDTVSRVIALYDYTPAAENNSNELSFYKGDIIKVLSRTYKEWWRGTLKGTVGIFPVNYVEPLPDVDGNAGDDQDKVLSMGLPGGKLDELLEKLKGIDTTRGDRVDENKEIEELYLSSIDMQGKMSALMKKYAEERTELEAMNASLGNARARYLEMTPPVPVPVMPTYQQPPTQHYQQQQLQQPMYPHQQQQPQQPYPQHLQSQPFGAYAPQQQNPYQQGPPLAEAQYSVNPQQQWATYYAAQQQQQPQPPHVGQR